MERPINKENSSLRVTSYCFEILLDRILKQFKDKYKGNSAATGRVTQLYGFGNYNASLPNLRKEFEAPSPTLV